MNKQDFVKAISKSAKITNGEAEAVLKAFVSSVQETLKKGNKVQLIGFGSFSTMKRAARKGVNPKTKEAINIPAKKVAKFVPGKQLKQLVAKGK